MSRRIRSIKPEWLDDEKIAGASDEARVLSVALIVMSDDYGRGRAALATIAAGAWQYQLERDDGAHAPEILARASRALRELVAIGFVSLYEVAGQRYFEIRNWSKHQKVDHPSKPQIPAPPEPESLEKSNPHESLAKLSRESPESLAPDQDQDQDRTRKGGGAVARVHARKATAAPSPGTDSMLRSLTPTPDRDASVVDAVSRARQAAGGGKFKPVGHADRDAVSRLGEWSAAMPPGDLDRVLTAFFAAKGSGARLSWLVEEDPGRYLGAPGIAPQKPGAFRPCPPASEFRDDDSDLVRWETKGATA